MLRSRKHTTCFGIPQIRRGHYHQSFFGQGKCPSLLLETTLLRLTKLKYRAEHMSGIIIASLPPLVHLFKSLGSKTIRTTRYTYGETAGGQSHAETLNGTSRPKFPSQKGYTRNLSDDTEFSMDDMTIKRETHVHVEIEPEHITAANKNADGAYIDGLGFHRRQD